MTLTLLALFMLPILFRMVLDPSGMMRTLKDWGNSSSMQFCSTLILMMLTLLILSTSEVSFKWDWESLLSWMAVLIGLKGVSHLFPGVVRWKMSLLKESRLPLFGFLGLVLALGLVYVDTQLL